MPAKTQFTANARTYQTGGRPIVVVCMDGSADEYLDAALVRGRMPNLQKICLRGYRGMARGALPSFTNVNNASIVTGVPPAVHGIGGNYFYDAARGEEVMMNSPEYLRAETILARAADAGRKTAVVTAKDKLRTILSHDLKGVGFSSEKAAEATLETHGIEKVEDLVGAPAPPIYSGEASLYALKAGVVLLDRRIADFLYLSLTDYMQHKYGPDDSEALDFYAAMDVEFGRLLSLDAVLGLTADHGMNYKELPDGRPNVLYLETMLNEKFGGPFRVILPITDPYVRHHGALGSFAAVHVPEGVNSAEVLAWILRLDGVTEAHDRDSAVRKLELPEDRIGDIVVLSGRSVVLGKTPEHHDLTALEGKLRSHGGRYEEMVPFIVSEPLNETYRVKSKRDVRNFDIFDFTVNGTGS